MRSLIEQSRDPGAPYTVCRVFSDKPDAAGLDLARSLGVPAQALSGAQTTDRVAYDRALAAAIQIYSPSLIVPRRIHAHPVRSVREGLCRKNIEHPSLAAAQISRPAYAPARTGGT